jgi:AraC-like DNA-binding protein/quercetin dioxygenase-like cupin family protein
MFQLPKYARIFPLFFDKMLHKNLHMRNLNPFSKALPVPDWLFREGVYATHAGWERIEPGAPYPQPQALIYDFEWDEGRILPEFCLSLCVEGRGNLETRLGQQEIHAGDAFLIRAGEWHRHRPDSATGWVNVWIHFNGDLPHEWMRDGAFRLSGNKPDITDRELFRSQFERLLDTVSANSYQNSAAISWQALGLLSYFVDDVRAVARPVLRTSRGIARRAGEFIINHTHTTIEVGDVAAHVGCSRRTLETRFKKATGRTVLEEIQHCRASRAKSLLLETDMPIKQIVHRAGFQSREHMRLVFRKLLGVTPGSFRRTRQDNEED